MIVTFVHHSCFVVEMNERVLIFDYFRDGRVKGYQFTGVLPEFDSEKPVYVFASHFHQDHFDLEILRWAQNYKKIHYILSKDIRLSNRYLERNGISADVKNNITFVQPLKKYKIEDMNIRTLRSTDVGVAFLIYAENKYIYHAGDLNDWRWPGEPESWNRQMKEHFDQYIEPLQNIQVDAAFLPLDPRQEDYYCLGFDYFLSLTAKESQKERIYPMHCWEDYGIIDRWLLEHPDHPKLSRVVRITGRGQSFTQ